MPRKHPARLALVGLLAVLTAACGTSRAGEASLTEGRRAAPAPEATLTEGDRPTTTTTVPERVRREVREAADEPTATTTPAPVEAPPPAPRKVHEQAWTPFASAGGVVLRHPSSRVELIGFHESNLDGARQLEPLPTAAPTVTLEGRNRDTGARTAADVVVQPESEIRAPVSGKVRYAGSYVLYCNHTDEFLIIEPDDHPGWEVKVLHIEGLQVAPGDRVSAGVTVIATRARALAFQSQVDKVTAKPSWPHVHIEVDDPTIPDRPSPRVC
jgi:murein DD-endopeptidase MepM/ murein hydrolase activator NlpD